MAPDSTERGLAEVYRQRLLELFRSPLGTDSVGEDFRRGWSRNRTCGDEVSFYLRFDGETVSACRQRTAGCAIATAAASLLTESLEGLNPAEVRDLLGQVRSMVCEGGSIVEKGELKILATVGALPSRHECVGVALDAVTDCLNKETDPE